MNLQKIEECMIGSREGKRKEEGKKLKPMLTRLEAVNICLFSRMQPSDFGGITRIIKVPDGISCKINETHKP